MSWSTLGNSQVFARTVIDTLGRGTAVDWDSDTVKGALFTNSGTPDATVTTDALTYYNGGSSQWVTGNESSATGYTAGGATLSSVALTQTTNVVKFAAANPSWTISGGTLTTYGILVYDTTVTVGLCFNYYGSQSVTSGTFTVAWNAGGIANFTC